MRQDTSEMRLPFACWLLMSFTGAVDAATLPPGTSATVNAGDAAESWTVIGASLTVAPGGQALSILTSSGATVSLDGATVNSNNSIALNLVESQGTIRNSTLLSTTDIGLQVTTGTGPVSQPSNALVENSNIQGVGRGLNVSGSSTATVIGTTLSGTGNPTDFIVDSGLGVSLVGGEAILRDSSATGSNHAAALLSVDDGHANSRLVVDHSNLVSQSGSAIVVSNLGLDPMLAQIEIRNGATVTTANGVLLQVGLPDEAPGAVAQAQLSIDASTLAGDIRVAEGDVADVTLSNGATLTGDATNVRNLSLNASRFAGTINRASTVNLAAGASLTGDLAGIGSLNLAGGSALKGTVTDAQTTAINGQSRFDMVNDSHLGALNLQDGVVNLRGGNGGFRTLTASSLSGNGTFVIGTDLAAGQGDLVNIEGQATGNHGLIIQNTGLEPAAGGAPLRVVHTEGGSASFSVLSSNGLVDVGAFSYALNQRSTDWYLEQADVPIISPSARTAIALFSAAPTVWYGELSTLRSRMGELRGGYAQGGFWARSHASKYRVSTADQVDYEQQQQGVTFGLDMPVASESGQWLLGILGGYSNSQLNLRQSGDGKVDSYYIGVYSTWLADSGYYVDAVLKANRFDNQADVRMSDGTKADGDYVNHAVGASVEAGRHFKLAEGWFVEPYLQVSALWVDGQSYNLDNGMRAENNKADSLLGKVGTHVGRTIPMQAGGYIQPYVKLAAVREFSRNNEVRANQTVFHDDLSGGRAELGAGLAIQLQDALQLQAAVDYSNGKNIEQPWGMSIGFHWAW